MKNGWRFRMRILIGLVAAILISVSLADAQGRQGRLGGAGQGVSPAELQRLFDAYVVMQAQRELQLTDDQYPQFLARVKALQDVRRRGQAERARLLMDLRRLAQARGDEAQIKARLKELDALDARAAAEEKEAREGVDQVLEPRQQALFRVFEAMMERRKLDLLMRARPSNRPRNQGSRAQRSTISAAGCCGASFP